MADPKDEDDFDSVLRSVGGGVVAPADDDEGPADDFDSTLKSVGLASADNQPAPTQPAEPKGTGSSWQDFLISLAEGASFGGMRKLGGPAGAVLSRGGPTARVFDEHDKNAAKAEETTAGQVGKLVGQTGASLALGGAAGPGVLPQAAAGGVTGAAASADESGGDPMSIATGGVTGGLLAALGGAAGARAESAVPLTHATRAQRALETLSEAAKKSGSQMGTGAALGALLGRSENPVDIARDAAFGAIGGKMIGAAGSLLPKAAPYIGKAARALGLTAAPLAGAAVARPSKASAQADVAYGTAPTMAWAVESVLQSGTSGLDPADEQHLTEAVMSGDEDRLIAANFTAQQRSPAFAARLRRELESLQEE